MLFDVIVALVLGGAAFHLPENDIQPFEPCGKSELVRVVGKDGDTLYTTCKR